MTGGHGDIIRGAIHGGNPPECIPLTGVVYPPKDQTDADNDRTCPDMSDGNSVTRDRTDTDKGLKPCPSVRSARCWAVDLRQGTHRGPLSGMPLCGGCWRVPLSDARCGGRGAPTSRPVVKNLIWENSPGAHPPLWGLSLLWGRCP